VKAFVTGATGFVGSHVAQALEAAGAELRLLARSTSPTKIISTLKNSEIVRGDLCDASTYKDAMRGCEAVFHVAADYRLWTKNAVEVMAMYRANVEGTRALIDAARQTGVKRIVYCSSVATMGFKKDGSAVDEKAPVSIEQMIGHYKRSKFIAEQVAMEAGKKGDEVIIVNPSTPVGEQDVKPTPTGKIIIDFLKKKFPAYVDTGLNVVDVRAVARGHVLAYERGKRGQRYILGGENLTLKQILDRLAAITGIPAPKIKLPYAFALGTGVVDTVFTGKVRGKEPRVTIDAVRMGRKRMWVRSAKAVNELGYKIVPVDDALRRACEWFRANGYV
jgi:dihydroflavonol-4-reductase